MEYCRYGHDPHISEVIMKWILSLALLATLVLGTKITVLPAADKPDETSRALQGLHGIWKLEGYESRGVKYPKDEADDSLFVFVEGTMLECRGSGFTRYSLKLNPTAPP